EQFAAAGADGAVIGVLLPDGSLDRERMEHLLSALGHRSITLHRAFDVCQHPMVAMEQAIALGIDTILTSGQKNTAVEGISLLRQLSTAAAGRIDILAGSGIDAQAIETIYQATGITSYHMSGKKILDSQMTYRTTEVHMGLDAFSEYDIWQTDGQKIKDAVSKISSLKH
ncbi:MAG: copper homeostasis protein CutC, partial [Clostridium sp.]